METTSNANSQATVGLGSTASLGFDITGRILATIYEYRKDLQAAEYPKGRDASKWSDYEGVRRFRKEYCARTPTSETMAIIQAWIRLDDEEQESAGYGGRSARAIGVMQAIDKAALTLPNTTLSHAGTSARKQDGAATGVGSSNS